MALMKMNQVSGRREKLEEKIEIRKFVSVT
jgi:hypothetical protein